MLRGQAQLTSFRWRAALVAAALLVLVGVGGASSFAATTPPTILVQVIGAGKVTGPGINCGLGKLQCLAAYGNTGTPIALTATGASGWSSPSWEDDAAVCGASSTCTVTTAAGNQTATVVFTSSNSVSPENLGVAVTGDSATLGGTVANGSTGYPINCSQSGGAGTDCSLTVVEGSTLAMYESPDGGELFAGWGGSCSGNNLGCAVYMNGNKAVSATFGSSATNALTVTITGNGTVTGGGLDCRSTCDADEPLNSTVTLTATADSGYAFGGWGGACSGTASTCTVTMDATRNVTAEFDQLIPVIVTVNGNGIVSGGGITCGPGPKSCTGGAAPGTNLVLTGAPATGTSVTWVGCTSTSGLTCYKTVPSSGVVAITATFGGGSTPPPTYSLAIDVNGDGYVVSTSGTTAIYCTSAGGTGCTTSVQQGTSLTLRAVPATGASTDFSGWGDDCDAFTSTTCTLTMTSPMTVTADFTGTSTTYTLSAQTEGTGTGTISGAGLHCSGSGGTGCSAAQAATATVTITATANLGSTFSGWSGACSGSSATCNVAMTAAKSVVATFIRAAAGKQPLSVVVTGAGHVKDSAGSCASTNGKSKTCLQEYTDGTAVTLTATPNAGYGFGGWQGACTGTKRTCVVTMSAAQAVSATFAPLPLAPGHKPHVARANGSYRVTLYFTARLAGTLKVVGIRGGTRVVSHTKKVKKGKGKVIVTVKRKGTYRFVLTLTAKKHRTSVRWVVKT